MNKLTMISVFIALPVNILFIACNDNDTMRIEASGTIEAVEVRIASNLSAPVARVFIVEGNEVQEGDTIAVLDSSRFDIERRQAKAGVELAEARLDLLLSGARDEDIRAAEEGVRQADANMKIAAEDFRRIKNLYESKSVPRRQLDEAEARLTVASAQFNTAGQNLEKLHQLSRPEEVRAHRALLAQAKAAVELIEKNIKDCYIVSPVGGIATNTLLERGELAMPGSTVAVVSKLDTVRLKIYLSTVDVGRIRIGQEVDVTIDSYPDKNFTGRITYISPSAEFTPRNIQTKEERIKQVFGVRVDIPNPERVLKPGLPADAVIRYTGPVNSD